MLAQRMEVSMVTHEFKSQRPVGTRVGARVGTAALSLLKAAEVRSLAGHRARITLQALERGHGRTLGQALRRGGCLACLNATRHRWCCAS